MSERAKFKLKKILLLALKIGVGASLAYYIAEALQLQYSSSAGIIALLTLQTTKWETVKLSIRRVFTYLITFGLCGMLCVLFPTTWIQYGIYLFVLVFATELLGWRSVVSVNAVIGAHLISANDFSYEFLMNELLLVIIGIAVAIVLNLFHLNDAHESGIIKAMRHVEHQMKEILQEMSGYLYYQQIGKPVWDDITELKEHLTEYLDSAHEFQNNTFVSHPEYYIKYFRMRQQQCETLQNMHSQLRKIRTMPEEAHIVSDFISEMAEHVTEMNDPQALIEKLQATIDHIGDGKLPATRDEFENKALLYHMLMDLEEFLLFKKRFIELIDEVEFQIYWKEEIQGKIEQ